MSVNRVAFLSSEYPPHTYGGLGTVVEELSKSLAGEGIEVVFLVPDATDYADPPPGVALCPVPVEGAVSDESYWLTYCESAVATARRKGLRVDIVHCHDWMTALGGIATGQALRVPVLMSVHLPQAHAYNLGLENIGIAGCDGVIVNSQAVFAELSRRRLGDAGISIIPNGVDLARFPANHAPANPQQILFVGRLVPQKGVDVLLRAFGALLHRFPDTTLLIAGDGQQRLYLERLARFLGLRQQVRFLGWQSRDELPGLYRAAAVTAVPSLYEPFGLVALEAMASGSPVVVSRIGGLTEIVDDASGFTVEPGDHLDLATRLAALLSDPELARAAGAAGRRRAEQFGWSDIACQTVKLYNSAAARAGRAELTADAIRQLLATTGEDLRQRVLALLVPQSGSPQPTPTAELTQARGHDNGC